MLKRRAFIMAPVLILGLLSACGTDNNGMGTQGYDAAQSDQSNGKSQIMQQKEQKGNSASTIANEAERISGVSKATVLLLGKDLVIGIEPDINLDPADIDQLEGKVSNTLKKTYPEYQVHVTADDRIQARIQSMYLDSVTNDVNSGYENHIQDIIRDIRRNVPSVPLRDNK